MSFDTFVVTYKVNNFLPKLVDMLLFSMEKTEFHFLVFPYFRVMPQQASLVKTAQWSDVQSAAPTQWAMAKSAGF